MKPIVVLGMAQPYPGYGCEQVTIVASCIPDTIVAFGQTRHTAPSLRLFVPNGLKEYCHSFLLNATASDVHSWCSRGSLLKTGCLERFLDEVRAVSLY
jgi:hypothetical protein